jgi:P-type Ca2+ transporter type 2C
MVCALRKQMRADAANEWPNSDITRVFGQFGENAMVCVKPHSTLSVFVSQFRSLMVLILVTANVVALVVSDTIKAAAIVVVVIINALIGLFTDLKAARALHFLRTPAAGLRFPSALGSAC